MAIWKSSKQKLKMKHNTKPKTTVSVILQRNVSDYPPCFPKEEFESCSNDILLTKYGWKFVIELHIKILVKMPLNSILVVHTIKSYILTAVLISLSKFAFCNLYILELSSIFVSVLYLMSIADFSHSASWKIFNGTLITATMWKNLLIL